MRRLLPQPRERGRPADGLSSIQGMSRSSLERRLTQVGERLKQLRAELAITDEQLAALADEADDTRLRALVSETPVAEAEHRDAQRHHDALARHRTALQSSIEQLERNQDELLDRLIAHSRG
jgi:transcriptional regulator with XRE-family HTH domain